MANGLLELRLNAINAQVAAEAFLAQVFAYADPTERKAKFEQLLQLGNLNNSVFPHEAGAPSVASAFTRSFTDRYEVVAYQDLSLNPNNGTHNGTSSGPNPAPDKSGFAAVLLKDRLAANGDSPYVLSVRSTEFADSILDTGDIYAGIEIGLLGASLGQLDSLNKFFDAARAGTVVADGQGNAAELTLFASHMSSGGKVSLTGYSLGGEIATLFGQLRTSEVERVTLINSAGIGLPAGLTTLSEAGALRAAISSSYGKFQAAFDDPVAYWNSLSASEQRALKQVTLRTGIGQAAFGIGLSKAGGEISYRTYERLGLASANAPKSLAETLLSYIQSGTRPQVPAGRDHGIYDDPRYLFASIVATAGWTNAWTLTDVLVGQTTPATLPRVTDVRFTDLYGASTEFTDMWKLGVSRSGLRTGANRPVYIEEQDSQRFPENFLHRAVSWDFGDGHSIVLLQDSLALMAAFERLAPTVTETTLGDIFERISNKKYDSLERGLDALRALILGVDLSQPAARTIGGSLPGLFGRMEYRGPYHDRLQALQSDVGFTSKAGQLTIESLGNKSAEQLVQDANDASRRVATRYALTELNPFVAVGAEYSLHNQSGELDELSAEWIKARSDMLVARMNSNVIDAAFTFEIGNENWRYEDYRLGETAFVIGTASGSKLKTDSSAIGDVERFLSRDDTITHHVLFDANQDAISRGGVLGGGKYGDYLFGGSGNDVLRGQAGDDYLEGGRDRDVLIGGTGADTLVGGKGERDKLDGGEGLDTYVWWAGDGLDFIVDAIEQAGQYAGQRAGTISFNGANDLSGTKTLLSLSNDKVFKDVVGNLYEFDGEHGRDGTLTIRPADGQGGLTILGYKDGDFGIVLSTANYQPTPVTDVQGTFDDDNFFSEDAVHHDSLAASASYQRVLGLDGDDRISVEYADAIAMGGSGADILLNGPGDQQLFGEEGNDILLASSGDDELYGGIGDDVLQGGLGDDYLDGGPEDATVVSSTESDHDLIDGGPGADVIFGGDGNDLLVGGGNLVPIENIMSGDHSDRSYGYKLQLDGSMRIEGIAGYNINVANPFNSGYVPWGAAQDGFFNVDGDLADFIDGGRGDDFVLSGDGDDVVLGGSGADLLVGQVGDDFVQGGTGDDVLMGDGSRNSLVYAGDVNMVYAFDQFHGADTLFGEEGNDVLHGDGGADELYGGADNDILIGDASAGNLDVAYHGDDYLDGGAGEDSLYGYGGDDVLFGGEGSDWLEGDGAESAIPSASHGDDYLDGEAGDDTLVGGGGADVLFGGDGNDTLAGDGDGVAVANHGADYLDGEQGDDQLQGYGGDDTLVAGVGNDTLAGGKGDDRYLVELGDGADTIIDGSGTNTVVFGEGITPAGLTLAQGLDAQGLGYLVINYSALDSLAIQGGFNGIQLFEFSDGKKLSPFALYEMLASAGAVPTVSGSSGNDTLAIGPLSQEVRGALGDDTYTVSRTSGWSRIVDQGGAQDRVLFGPDISPSQVSFVRRANGDLDIEVLDGEAPASVSARVVVGGQFSSAANRIETFEFDDGSVVQAGELDSLTIAATVGTAADDALTGTADETFSAGAGNDSLAGGYGDNVYQYAKGDGSDLISDLGGLNRIEFSAGVAPQDVFVERRMNEDLVLTLEDGGSITVTGQFANPESPVIDEVRFADGSILGAAQLAEVAVTPEIGTDAADTLSGGQSDDTVYGLEGNDSISGNSGNDVLIGGQGEDALQGGQGDDVLSGEEGHDTLHGGEGQDLLYGDDGDDFLDGGPGSDLLVGGGGTDSYSIYGGIGSDQVIDGEAGDGNVLQLRPGLTLDNLKATQVGDDLIVSLRGLSDSLTIADYYTRTQGWVVRDFDGVETSLESFINLPDPYAGDHIGRLWADTKAGGWARVLGMAQAIGWKALDANTFEGVLDYGMVDYARQTTVETFTRFDPPRDVLAQNTTVSISSTLDHFGTLSSSIFRWHQHSFESNLVESDDALISAGLAELPQLQSSGQALLTLQPTPWTFNYQTESWSSWGGVVSYDSGTETILANVEYEYDLESYTRMEDVANVNPDPGGWVYGVNDVVGSQVLVNMNRLENRRYAVVEIIGGASDNQIYGSSSSSLFPVTDLIDGGAGNDYIYAANGLLYGNTGDDQLNGWEAILIGGDGNDTITGHGGSRFVYTATESGIDAIEEDAVDGDAYLDWYFGLQGAADWRERAAYGGKFRADFGSGDGDYQFSYFDTLQEAQDAGGNDITYIEPLSSLAPLIRRSDAAALESLEVAGVLKRDVVEFAPGLELADLALSIRVFGSIADQHPEEPWYGGGTLSVRWGAGAGFDVEVADSGYGVVGGDLFADLVPDDGDFTPAWEAYQLGRGVELFQFADGSTYSLDQVLQLAALDRIDGYVFVRNSGSQLVEGAYTGVDFAADIALSDVYAFRSGTDLLFGVIADSALGRIPGWYASPATIPDWEFRFADGTVLDSDAVTRLGLTWNGSESGDYLPGDPEFSSALLGHGGVDNLVGGSGNDLLDGGADNDYLAGYAGDDIYVFGAGYGTDFIYEAQADAAGGSDTLRFEAGVSTADIVVDREWDTLILSVGSSGDAVRIASWFNAPGGIVETFAFPGGTSWGAAQVEALLPPTVATQDYDVILGGTGADLLQGLGGNDEIQGFAGDDTLEGGLGNDFLLGGPGDDIYHFEAGDGADYIVDPSGQNVLRFGAGIAAQDVRLTRDETTLFVLPGGAGDSVGLADWFYSGQHAVSLVEFADGTTWTAAELESRVSLIPATGLDDNLWGTDGDDFIDGLAGSDQIFGNDGNDVLLGGDGYDYLVGNAGNDVLRGGEEDDSIVDDGADGSSNLLEGGGGADYLSHAGNSLVIGEGGDDWIEGYGPDAVVAFNPGDGADTVYVVDSLTLSIGGGVAAQDLSLSADGDDIVLSVGAADSVRLSRQWEDDPRAWPPIRLQLFGSVYTYDLNGAIDEFYLALDADPLLANFPLGDVLPDYLVASSETEAYGGAIAYQYATTGSTDGLSIAEILAILQQEGFGSVPQAINAGGANAAPTLDGAIADQSASEDASFSFAVPADTFSDPDAGDVLTYSATQADGSALPAWLSFDAQTQTFSGTPLQADVGAIDVKVTATDGGGLSAQDTFTLTVANVNDAPVVSAANAELLLNGSALASALFSVFDEDGQSPTQYQFWDDVAGGGYFAVNGVEQGASAAIPVPAADLANTQYVAGSTPGIERVWARAYDGAAWSAWKSWNMTSALHIPNAAPEATPTAATQTVLLDQAVAASSLFSVTDADGDPAARYEFFDSTEGNGHFTVNGVEQGVNVAIPVLAADLANTQFVGASSTGSDRVWVRATDGQTFGAWKSWTMNSWPHATNAAPVADAPNGEVLRNQAVLAQSLFSVADADGDAIARYEFWDDTAGGGYFALGGVAQSNNPIPVAAAELAGLEYVGGAETAVERVWVRANDGMQWGAWESWNMTTALHIPNAAPDATPAAATQTVLLGQAVDASTLFNVADADGDPIARFEFFDSTEGGGHFTVNGVQQGVNVAISVVAADLASTQFVGASSTGSDQVWVRATDGQSFGAWKSWTMNSWPHLTNAAPVADGVNTTVISSDSVAAATLFTVSDADGDAPVRYEFWDDVNGGGYWSVNGIQQVAAAAIAVDAADLANTEYVGGANTGSERVWVRVNDGMQWGAWESWTMNSWPHLTNAAPVATASSSTILLGQSVAAATLFSVTDADGDAVTQYQFFDSTAGNGHFTVNGVQQGVNVAIGVTAAQLADTAFVGGSSTGSDTVWVRAHDGMAWGAWKSWTMNSWPHLTNIAPVVSATNAGILANEALSASMFFGVSDADGDAPTAYQFWDDVNGGGYWSLDGVQQASASAIAVSAADLASLDYVGGASPGTERVWARASDGMGWGAWKSWFMSTEGGMLRGGDGPDTLNGEAGPTVLQGGAGNDTLTDTDGDNLFSGGEGDDTMTGGEGDDLFAGGVGNDVTNTGGGSNVIAYNAGGGIDTVYAGAGAANTLSFGGGIGYEDLSLSKQGNDLIVSAGENDQVVLKDWYSGSQSVLNLQIILDASDEFDANSSDPLYNKKVQTFDFLGMVGAFDDALAQSPGLTSWAVTNALLAFHLSGADDLAIGGDLAYWYGKNNGFTGISLAAAQQVIGAAGFGSDAQTLRPFSGLQEGYVKLA